MQIENVEQGSDAWLQLRLGRLTASRVADAIAKTKTGWGASRANLMAELIAERLTGVPGDKFTNAAMAWGTEQEPEARAAYEFYKDCDVMQVGFVHHPLLEMAGCSPDGLVGEFGLVEIKAPNTATHIETLLAKRIPSKYETQMQFQMACTGRAWCDFVSFDPRLPESMRLYVQRLMRSNERIAELNDLASEFLRETAEKESALRALYERKAA